MTPTTVRQKQILDATMRLIAEKGVQGFTMRQVGAELGISEPAVYRHYEGKLAVLEALLDLFQGQVGELASLHLHGEQAGMKRFFAALLVRLDSNPVWSAVIFSEEIFQNEPVLAKKVKGIMDFVESSLLEHIGTLEMKQQIPARHVAWMFLGSVRLLVTRWRLSHYAFSLTGEGEPLLASLCQLFHLNVRCDASKR